MAVQLSDGVNSVPVDTTSKGLVVQNPKNAAQAGFVGLAAIRDPGAVTGTPNIGYADITNNRRLRVALDTPLFQDQFNYTAQNTTTWKYTTTTMTATWSGGAMTINGGAITTASTNAVVQTYRSFPLYTAGELTFACRGNFTNAAAQANNAFWMGIGNPGTTAAPTDGVFFQLDATGALRGVVVWNGTVSQSSNAFAYPSATVQHEWMIVIDAGLAEFWIDGVLQASLAMPAGTGTPTLQSSGYAFFQMANSATAPATAQTFKVYNLQVTLYGMDTGKPWPMIKAGEGLVASQGQNGGTVGTTAGNLTNNGALPTASAGSNTTALTTGLGGLFNITAQATGTTDNILTSFQNPVGSVNQTPRTLYITGVRISMYNAGAAVATTSTNAILSLAFGHTSVALNTTESATSKAPRRIALGMAYWAIGAPIGMTSTPGDIVQTFATPIPVQPGEYIATVMKFAIGTATTSQSILGAVNFDGFYE